MQANREKPRLVKAHLDAKLYDEFARLAAANDRPLAREVRRAVQAHVAREQKAGAP